MEQYGNTTTYNLESVLLQNIKRSLYWERRAKNIVDWNELVDEIFERCGNPCGAPTGNSSNATTHGTLKPHSLQRGQCGAMDERQCAWAIHRLQPALPPLPSVIG
jgi:hypothetical protein